MYLSQLCQEIKPLFRLTSTSVIDKVLKVNWLTLFSWLNNRDLDVICEPINAPELSDIDGFEAFKVTQCLCIAGYPCHECADP